MPLPEAPGVATKMYEHRSQPLLPRALFVRRVLLHALAAAGLTLAALMVGVFGYHVFAQLSWLDALLNAAMILGGMGPVNVVTSAAGKLFASFYALFSGIAFLATSAILIAPVAHRLLHRLHLDEDHPDEEDRPGIHIDPR